MGKPRPGYRHRLGKAKGSLTGDQEGSTLINLKFQPRQGTRSRLSLSGVPASGMGLPELGGPGHLGVVVPSLRHMPSGTRSWSLPPSAIEKACFGNPGIWLMTPHKCPRAWGVSGTVLGTGDRGLIIKNHSLPEKGSSQRLVLQVSDHQPGSSVDGLERVSPPHRCHVTLPPPDCHNQPSSRSDRAAWG